MKQYQMSASIVVYRNDPTEVTLAVKSVLSSPMRVKCTVVDNSPTPDLRQCVTDAGATYIFVGRNLGFGGGHNLAMSSDCKVSEYHLVLNPDVSFQPEIIATLCRLMDENPDIGMVMPKVLYPSGSDQHLCKQLPSPLDLIRRRFLRRLGTLLFSGRISKYELRRLDLSTTCNVPCLSGCFMFIRSDVLREVGLFDERYFMYMEDVDLCRRIGTKYKTVFYPWVAVIHGYAKGSYRQLPLLVHHVQSAFKYFCKWGWIFDRTRDTLNDNARAVAVREPQRLR